MKTFESFARANHVCLFATDVAARGLDFPAVDWVVQADCPEDVPCYIHRVGRTARYTAEGKGLLLLTPSEAKFAEELAAAKVPLKTMRLNQAKNVSITSSIQGLLGKDSELKYLAQRAVVSYLRSVYLQPNKDVFDVDALDVEAFANSVGLPNPPRLRFLKSQRVSNAGPDDSGEDDDEDERGANETKADEDEDDASGPASSSESESESGADEIRDRGVVKRAGGGHFGIQVDGADEDDDLMTVKRADHGMDGASDEDLETAHADLSVAARAALAEGPADPGAALRARAKKGKLRIKAGGHGGNDRVVFGEDGEAMAPLEALGDANAGPVPEGGEALAAAARAHYDRVRKQRLEADVADRAREKQRLRDMRDKNKAKERKLSGDDDDGAGVAVLGEASDDDDASSDSGGSGRDRGGSDDDSDSNDSDSDSDSSDRPQKRAKTDVSVAGMALKSETVESMEERAMRLLEGK